MCSKLFPYFLSADSSEWDTLINATVIYVVLIKISNFPLFVASVERRAASDEHAAIPHKLRQIGCTPMNYLPPYIYCQ